MPRTHNEPNPRFEVGAHVVFRMGVTERTGVISEYRGPLGVGGRNIYRVRMDRDEFEVDAFEVELPEVELSKASARAQST